MSDHPVKASVSGVNVVVRSPYSEDTVARFRRVRETCGGGWDAAQKAWVFPDTSSTWAALHSEFGVSKPAPRPSGGMPYGDFEPWQHQKDAFEFAFGRTATLLAHDMGCVTGDTVVALNRCGRGFSMTVRELYRKVRGPLREWRRDFSKPVPTMIRSLLDDRFGLNELRDVVYKGVQPVLRIETEGGKSITLTPDHEVLTPQGYVAAAGLRAGDVVITNGKMIDKDGYVRVFGVQHPRKTTSGVYEHLLVAEKMLGRSLRPGEQVHHINRKRADNRPENLRVVSAKEHLALHRAFLYLDGGGRNGKQRVFFVPKEDKIVSVVPAGEEPVYDLICADPWRNFVANGIVVHNCGKSATAISLINAWRAKRVLVVCPLSVVPVWPKQFAMHSANSYNVVALDNCGSVARRKERAEKALQSDAPTVLVINYEGVRREPFASWALAQQWDALVLDECHRVKAPTGLTSRFVARLRNCAARRVGLSGTPLAHSPLDAFGVCRALDEGLFGRSYYRFKRQWAVMGGYQGYEFLRLANPDAFAQRLGIIMHRVEKRDVLDLPKTVHEQRYCTLSGAAARAYKEMEQEFTTWVAEDVGVTATNALVKLLRLQQITGGNVMGDDGQLHAVGNDKARAFADFLSDHPKDEPLVVFARFSVDVDVIAETCEEAGLRVARMTGAVKELAAWQRGDAEVLVSQIQVGSEGIDLTRAATCVVYSLGYSLAQYMQALARLDRPGQTRSVTYVHILAKGTVDERVMEALDKRQQVVETIINASKRPTEGVRDAG